MATHLLFVLGDAAWRDLVHELAEEDAVLQDVGVVSLGQGSVKNGRDPLMFQKLENYSAWIELNKDELIG